MASQKFGRNYKLSIQTTSGATLVIEPPFTLEFDITRTILSSANISTFRIYNLGLKTRNQIRKNFGQYDDVRQIQLQAGYGSNLPVIFTGNIGQAWSVREGTDFVTEIESFDGGFAFETAQTDTVFQSGTPQSTIIRGLAGSLPGVKVGKIGSFPGVTSRQQSFSGNTIDILREQTGNGIFIDNGIVNCMGDNECFQGSIQVIDASTGLLGTPVLEETVLHFDILFEPRLVIGQQLQLQSLTGANFNTFYKVISVKHRGMVSESTCGTAVTTVGVFFGTAALRVIP